MKIPASALLSLFLFACATSTETSTENENDELVNAPVDTKNTWSVGVCASEPNTDPAKGPLGACLESGTRCSGSLIAPDLVMTAQHCVKNIDYSQATGFCDGKFTTALGAGKVRVTLDPSVLAAQPKWIDVKQVIVPGSELSCQNDIAILKLARAIPAADATPIRLDLRDLVRHHPKTVAVVGRGILTALVDPVKLAPIDEADGGLTRRFRTGIPWGCVSNGPRECDVFDLTSPPSNKFVLPAKAYFSFGEGTSSGDSGAAILSSTAFAAGRKVAYGVHSAGTFGPTGVGNFGHAVRLDTHKAFITTTLTTNGTAADSVVCDDTNGCD